MTRKDYIIVADALKASKPADHWDANKKAQWIVSLNRLCEHFLKDNARFNRGLFLKACGVTDGDWIETK